MDEGPTLVRNLYTCTLFSKEKSGYNILSQPGSTLRRGSILVCTKKYSMYLIERVHAITNNVVSATSKASDQPAHTHSLIRAFASR